MSASPNHPAIIADVRAALPDLQRLMAPRQLNFMLHAMRGEESQFFIDKLVEMADRFRTMHKTYDQRDAGDQAIVHLHYFRGACDWYITERDVEPEQIQAFGMADLGYGPELGYISIEELQTCGVELDLHFTPRTLSELKAKRYPEKKTEFGP